MPSKRRHMVWILIGVLISYLLVNSPLIYSLLHVHGWKGIGKLWGYAPNQFLFLVLFFPFAAFATLSALRLFILKIYPTLPPNSWLGPFVDHWPVSLLGGLVVAALFTILVYFTSGWSFDKLHPDYAQGALKAAEEFETKVEDSSKKKDEQEAFRKQLIRKAKHELESLAPPAQRDEAQVSQWLHALPPEVYLQVVQSHRLPHQLRLLHPAIHALNVFQLFIVLFLGSIAMFVAGVCIYYGYEADYSGTNLPELKPTIEAVFWAVFFFSFYVVCYHQYRSQMEEVVGTGTTILQDVLAGIIVAAVLIGIRLIDPNNRVLSALTIIRFLPIAIFASGVVVEETLPHLTRQLIGNETTLGFQVAFSAIFTVLALIPTVRLALLE
jgi:hypothetical protein